MWRRGGWCSREGETRKKRKNSPWDGRVVVRRVERSREGRETLTLGKARVAHQCINSHWGEWVTRMQYERVQEREAMGTLGRGRGFGGGLRTLSGSGNDRDRQRYQLHNELNDISRP